MKVVLPAFALSASLLFPTTLLAAPSINEMQGCQAVLDFVSSKLDSAPANYAKADIEVIRKGLAGYNLYIQDEIITPGLLSYNKGDSAKAGLMQQQVNAYKQSLVVGLNSRYQNNRLYTDHAVAINECAKKAVPSGQALQNLKSALNTIVELAKLN